MSNKQIWLKLVSDLTESEIGKKYSELARTGQLSGKKAVFYHCLYEIPALGDLGLVFWDYKPEEFGYGVVCRADEEGIFWHSLSEEFQSPSSWGKNKEGQQK